MLVEFSTPIPNDIYVHEDNTSDSEYVLTESSLHVHVVRYSLATSMIVDEIEHKTNATSIVTYNKLSEFLLRGYRIHTYFSHEEKKLIHLLNLHMFDVRPLRKPYISFSCVLELYLVCLTHCICMLYMMRSLDRYEFAMMTTNLLHIYIVSCRNLQLIMR